MTTEPTPAPGSIPAPQFSAQRHSDATPSAGQVVPGNDRPTFLAAAARPDTATRA